MSETEACHVTHDIVCVKAIMSQTTTILQVEEAGEREHVASRAKFEQT